MDMNIVYIAITSGLIAILFGVLIAIWIASRSPGTRKIRDISMEIQMGAVTFLNREYGPLFIFVVGFMFILGAGEVYFDKIEKFSWIAFGYGALLSAAAGNIGMRIATLSNGRTAYAAESSMKDGLQIAFSSGAVMGLMVSGLGLVGIATMFVITGEGHIEALYAFGFGASSIALFARLGGGIFTKSADVGADLVGKVDLGIPEDDPRNPAVIADNVGDNVGDVAGMGADLFESYVDAIIATMALGAAWVVLNEKTNPTTGDLAMMNTLMGDVTLSGEQAFMLPLVLTALGIFSSLVGILSVYMLKDFKSPRTALLGGTVIGALTMAVISIPVMWYYTTDMIWELYITLISGLLAGLIIGFSTDYFTSESQLPTRSISKSAVSGAGTAIITGLSVGLLSVTIPVVTIGFTLLIANHYAGLFGISLAAMGMLSTLGITLSIDTYGPVADNAAGIAEMAKRGKTARRRAEELDAVGNSTAAIGKGFAIGSAALAALALFSTFQMKSGLDGIDLTHAEVTFGLFIGALMPFVFSALAMSSVGKAAVKIVQEVKRQFEEIPGLREGKTRPDTQKCIAITTQAAIREMILPTLLVIIIPIAIGFYSLEALGGFLAGSLVSGLLMAIFMANSGGAWDNAKKYIESGHYGGKGSEAHKAAVVGDTVGDPLKDTAGPSLNILIKLMSIVALVFLPFFM